MNWHQEPNEQPLDAASGIIRALGIGFVIWAVALLTTTALVWWF